MRIARVLRLAAKCPCLVGHSSLVEHLGQPPIHHLDFAEVPHHHVRRLQVAVDHAATMGVSHRLAHVLEDLKKTWAVFRRVLARFQKRRQRAAAKQLHRDEKPLVRKLTQLIDRHDSRVLKLPADLGFLHKPPHQLGVAAVLLQKHLDRQVASEIFVAALQHHPHSPARDLPQQVIPAGVARQMNHLVGVRTDGPLVAARSIPQQHSRNRPDRVVQRGENT